MAGLITEDALRLGTSANTLSTWMIVMPKKNRARRHPKKDNGIFITDEAWEAARKSITLINKNVLMLPPGSKVHPPRVWEYPQTWNLPKDPDVETQPSTTETPTS